LTVSIIKIQDKTQERKKGEARFWHHRIETNWAENDWWRLRQRRQSSSYGMMQSVVLPN